MNDFKGPESLKQIYEAVSNNLSSAYKAGISLCLAGPNGVGKSLTATNILKKCCYKNYSCLYTTLLDIINILIDAPMEQKFKAKFELLNVDFLVIDEFDHIQNGASDLYGKYFEHILRTRSQNRLPLICCTNSPNPVEAFNGSLKTSLSSLMSNMQIIPAIGKDFRKQ